MVIVVRMNNYYNYRIYLPAIHLHTNAHFPNHFILILSSDSFQYMYHSSKEGKLLIHHNPLKITQKSFSVIGDVKNMYHYLYPPMYKDQYLFPKRTYLFI